MNNRIFLLLIFFVFFPTFSYAIEILSQKSPQLVYAGKTTELKIPIKNDGPSKESILITLWPTQWVSLEKYWLTLEKKQTELLTLYITPPEDSEEGILEFTLTVQSLETGDIFSSPLYVDIKREKDVFISDVRLNNQLLDPGQILQITTILSNLHKSQKQKVYLTTFVNFGEMTIKVFQETVTIDPKSVKEIKNFYEIGELQKFGDYSIVVELRDSMNKLLDKESKIFRINKKSEVLEKRTVDYGLFYAMITIEITNKGNVPDANYTVEESLPKITQYFFFPDKEPDMKQTKENRIVYLWAIEELQPGETTTIRYKLRFINALISLIILSLILIFIFDLSTRPALSKRHSGRLGEREELKIILHVKNNRKGQIKNIVVRDFVPAIAKVVMEFDTLTPEVHVKSSGTDLIWHIDKLNPGEERVLTYKIQPLIDVIGKLTLPKAYMTHSGKFKFKRKIVSKSISIIGKIK